MTRFLHFTLLFLIALPAFAQDGPPVLGQALPNDPALLMRMRDQLSIELQRTQQTLGIVLVQNPNDVQLIETLTTQQADLARQINEVMRQLHSPSPPNIGGAGLPGADARLGGFTVLPPGLAGIIERQIPDARQTEPVMPLGIAMPPENIMPRMPGGSMMGGMPPGMPMPGITPGMLGGYHPQPSMLHNMPMPPAPVMPNNAPQWGNHQQAWEEAHWGPRLPRELTEMRQSVESLQREISSLRDTVRQLETQIQLLNRNILLNDRANERMNEWMIERMNENGE